jgi:hypothetical protein
MFYRHRKSQPRAAQNRHRRRKPSTEKETKRGHRCARKLQTHLSARHDSSPRRRIRGCAQPTTPQRLRASGRCALTAAADAPGAEGSPAPESLSCKAVCLSEVAVRESGGATFGRKSSILLIDSATRLLKNKENAFREVKALRKHKKGMVAVGRPLTQAVTAHLASSTRYLAVHCTTRVAFEHWDPKPKP